MNVVTWLLFTMNANRGMCGNEACVETRPYFGVDRLRVLLV